MTIEQSLLKYGFKHYKVLPCNKELYKNCDEFYQLKVYSQNNDDKLYIINGYLYDFSVFMQAPDSLAQDLQAMFDVQFTLKDDKVFNVEYSTQDVEEALHFFEKMYNCMGCEPYEKLENM